MLEYWVWISYSLEAGSPHLKPLLEKFKTPKAIYEASVSELADSYILSPSELKRFNNKALDKAFRIISECEETKINIVTYDSDNYPECLRNIPDPPPCLYVKGKMQDFKHHPIICIIGTRKVSEHGKLVAWSLAGRLAAGGVVVLSGGALGGDTEAHEGALAVGGKTIAVLPCGINYDYLKTNIFLRGTIQDNGCLISELPPDTPLHKNAFQIRNRLMSALSLGIVVVEAPAKSGTMITARHALEQGRDVYAVPGNVMSSKFLGVHKLINDGAKPVFSAFDVLYPYAVKYPKALDVNKIENELQMTDSVESINTKTKFEKKEESFDKDAFEQVKDLDGLSGDAKTIYGIFTDGPIHIDDIARKTALDFSKIFSAVTELELWDLIESRPGKLYIKK